MTAVDERRNPLSRSKGSAGARRDLLVISICALVAFCVGVAFNLFEVAHDWLVSSSPIPEDDVLAVIVVLLVAFGILAIRTLRRVGRETELRRESENRYRAMVERVPAVAYTWDSGGVVGVDPASYISPQIERLLGYTAEEWSQDPTIWQRRAHPMYREPVLRAWADAATRGLTFASEYRLRAADGRWVWIRDQAVPVSTGPRGRPIYHGVMVDVTEQKRSEQRLRQLVEELPVVTYLSYALNENDDHPLPYMAPGILELTGHPAEEWMSRPELWRSMVHPDDRERVFEEDRETDRSGDRFEIEYRFMRDDGRVVWVHDKAVLVEQDGDRPVWQGIMEDITARREAEGRLREAEERFRAVVEQIPALTYIEDPVTAQPLYVSPQVETMLGFTAEEWSRDAAFWEERIHPEDRRRVLASNASDGDEWSELYRTRAKDGRMVWVDNHAVLIRDDDGAPRFWLGVAIDTTERMENEERLRLAQDRYRYLLERLPTAVYIDAIDAIASAIYISPQYERLTGYSPEERLADPELWVRMLHPDDRERVIAESDRTNATGDPFDVEYRLRAKDGRIVWVHDLAYQVEDQDGSPCWQGVLTDITQRKLTEATLSRRDKILEAMGHAAEGFLGVSAWTEAIPDVLANLGRAGGASRAAVYRRVDDDEGKPGITLVAEWTAEGVAPLADIVKDQRFGFEEVGLARWANVFSAGDHINTRTEDLPDQERTTLEHAGVKAIVAMPIFVGGEWWGHLLYDQIEDAEIWQQAEVEALRVMANTLGAAISRERSARVLSDTEARYRGLIETIPAATYIDTVDAVSKAIYMSPQVEQIFGYSPEEWVQNPELWEQGVDPDDLPAVASSIRRLNEEGIPYEAEYRFRRPDGQIVWVHDQAVVIRDADGVPQLSQGVMFDVTQRREAEEQLREAEERFRAIVEHVPAGIYVDAADASLQTTYASPQVEAITGIPAAEWIRNPDAWTGALHPDDREDVLGGYLAAIAAEQPWSAEYRIRTRDGRTIWVHDETTLIHDQTGRHLMLLGVISEITERKLAEQSLRDSEQREREAAARLRTLDEMKNTFLAAVSHELRSPLTSILGLSLTLERSEMAEDDRNDLLERLAANARKLDRLLKDLLDIDRLNRGIVEPQYRVIDVGALARRTVESLDSLADRTVTVLADPVEISADPAKVERIVENLLMNAARHTTADKTIWLKVRSQDEGVLIAVEDDGDGVPEELREAVFEPFRQGPTSSPHAPGTGIGLSLVGRFSALHGGRAWIEEREGGGASFRVFLPAGPSTVSPATSDGGDGTDREARPLGHAEAG
jgi:PAS domain S-box-containing protein